MRVGHGLHAEPTKKLARGETNTKVVQKFIQQFRMFAHDTQCLPAKGDGEPPKSNLKGSTI